MLTTKNIIFSISLIFVSLLSATNVGARELPNFVELIDKTQSSVVSISTTVKVRRRNIFSRQSPSSSRGPSGSGFVISKDGYVITNNHVIDGVEKVYVSLNNGRDFEAEIVGTDEATDIALLKIEGNNFDWLEIGDIDKTRVGSWVVAIGAPFGFEHTVTAGIISAKGRNVGEQYIPYVQTDVAINPGNSGGPLINMNGKVVGVNSKILSISGGSNGLSFSIPIDLVMDVVGQIKDTGNVLRGYLGVSYQEVSFELAKSFGLERSEGALITVVTPNSPADQAGIKRGDIVLMVDDKLIKNSVELPFVIGRYRPGREVKMSLVRDGKHLTRSLEIGSKNPEIAQQSSTRQEKDSLQWLGAEFKNIPEELKERRSNTRGEI
ncbi:MAG: trypsin-like peptidase domain-containing protein, partial [Kangiellaceae bacterium]|nr:trypsin-like peptidase domain-containing protein [Kangiellaceae bacterium]